MGGTHFLQTGYLLLNRNAPFIFCAATARKLIFYGSTITDFSAHGSFYAQTVNFHTQIATAFVYFHKNKLHFLAV